MVHLPVQVLHLFFLSNQDVFVGGVVWTQMGMGSAQAINAAWLTAKMEDHKRPVALAAYVMSIQLANFPGNQLFRAQGKSIVTARIRPGKC